MTFYEFIALVAEMRKWQRRYFANHSRQALAQAQNLENRVDRAIEELEARIPRQGDLFK